MTARITLYSRPGCHLCDDARAVIEAVCADLRTRYPGDAEVQAALADAGPGGATDAGVVKQFVCPAIKLAG